MKKILVSLMSLVFVVGCAKDPVSVAATNNPNVPVSKLFDFDGCSVYRFNDNGHYHYYARCGKGETTTTTNPRTESCGKGCSTTKDYEINLENR